MKRIHSIFLCFFVSGLSFSAFAGRILAANTPGNSYGAGTASNYSVSNNANNSTSDSSALGMSFNQVESAAERGDPDAQYALGYMYYYGQGTTKDDIAAKVWIEKAAAQGQPQAQKALDLINHTNYPDKGKVAATRPMDTSRATGAVQMPNSVAAAQSANDSDATAQAAAGTDNSVADINGTPGSTAVTPSYQSNQKSKHTAKQYSSQEKRLLREPSHYYTLQLLGAFQKNDVIKIINHYRLGSKAAYYRTSYEGKPWYVLVYGTYRNDHEAEAAIARLPKGVRKLEPWVKSMASVHNGIRKIEK